MATAIWIVGGMVVVIAMLVWTLAPVVRYLNEQPVTPPKPGKETK